MLDLSTLNKYDTSGMYKVYDRWPKIAIDSFEHNFESVDFKDVEHIVFAGMGGSGAIGDIFSAILSKTEIHVNVVKGYILPKTVDSETLVVLTSVSGNTGETLTVLDSAKKLGCKIVAFSSGGKMEQYSKDNNIEYRKIQQYNSPRASLTSFLYSSLKTIESILPIKKTEILESLNALEDTSKKISSNNLTEENPSLSLANWILGTPLIYYPWGLQAAAIRFKNSLQENSKSHAIAEDIIEACHNGIVAWEKLNNFQPILLEGTDDYIKTKERWKIIKEFFQLNNINYWEILSNQGNILSKITNMIYLLDYATIYLAVKNRLNPSPVNSIDYIKQRL